MLVGALSAPLTYAIARDAGARPEVRWGAGVLAAIPAAGTVFMPQPENFALLQPIVAATLWLAARGLRGAPVAFALTGLLVGLASLARNDGFLLGAAVGLLFLWDRWRAWRRATPPRIPWRAAFACFGLFLLVVGPWYLRQLAVFGSISPTSSSGYALWIRTVEEWNRITADPSLGRWLAQGAPTILTHMLGGLVAAIAQFVVIICSVVLVPFLIVGAWRRRASPDFRPWFVYTALVFLGAAILYPLHVPGGAFIHTAVGLGPHAYILALEGVVAAVAWLARRRRRWNERTASAVFVGALVAFVAATGLLYALALHRELGRGAAAARRAGGGARSDGGRAGGAAAVDRRRRAQVLHGAGRRRHAGRSDRHDRGGRTGLPDALARPRAGRGGRGAGSGPARRARAGAGSDLPPSRSRGPTPAASRGSPSTRSA